MVLIEIDVIYVSFLFFTMSVFGNFRTDVVKTPAQGGKSLLQNLLNEHPGPGFNHKDIQSLG